METRSLPVKLTQEELDLRRDKLAELVRDISTAEQARSDAASAAKKEIDKLDASAGSIAREIRERSEYRQVEVTREKDYRRRIEEVIRSDTGEVVDSRVLGDDEMQGKLFEVETKRSAK
jgi:hypothetical protein